jgi:predicted nuclease of restriction endonuclease-like (RecB) superfamily
LFLFCILTNKYLYLHHFLNTLIKPEKTNMQPIKHLDSLHSEAKQIIETGRRAAYQAVNNSMVQTYWELGQLIVEEEQAGKARADYGKYLIEELSKRLTADFGKGYDKRNLFYMKQFYLTYPIVNAVRSQLTWTHYRLLMKVQNPEARAFYEAESIKSGWNTRALERQINVFYYERLLASQDKKAIADEAAEKVKTLGNDVLGFIKDPYVLEFLGAKPDHRLYENELEQGLIDNLQVFLLELGNGFSFVARQKYIRAENEDFFIDLVFYNFILKCFVLIDLKIGKLSHQDIGQMDMYVRMYEDLHKIEGDNPTIGLILCSEKNEAVVKYSVLKESEQLFASKYLLYLPSEAALKAELERERHQVELKMG